MPLALDHPLQYLKGVGPKRAEALATLGLHTVGDLLHYYPFRHELQHGDMEIAELTAGITATVRGEVRRVSRRGQAATAEIDDGTQPCLLRWFNTRYIPAGVRPGALVVATGKVEDYSGVLNIVQPKVDVFAPDAVLPRRETADKLVGVYRSNQHVTSTTIRRIVETVLAERRLPLADVLPPALRERHKLPTREAAVRAMHQPRDQAQLAAARKRLAYEEFFLMELALAMRRHRILAMRKGRRLPITPEIDARIRTRFPFALTEHQNAAIREISADLASGRPMTRLLQGDVGSGKTVVALYACLAAIANGCQAAIMAPTEILAQQHFANVEQYLAGSRVRRVLLRGGMPRRERDEALRAIEAGQIDLVVGTHALLQKDVGFAHLAMVIVDEQHKFGVAQRADLRTKGPMPHGLVMTATPIPRSLAMTVLGDLDVSTIKASPPGRGTITTKVVMPAQWPVVMQYVRERLLKGEQAYVVCPLIGEARNGRDVADGTQVNTESRKLLVSAEAAYKKLTEGPWRDLRVGLLHGGLRSDDKQATVQAFARGELHALVATTVVEVGVDVPNATIMVVENADRFGLSQLHQLRGRVGRGPKESLCVLIARTRGAKSRERLDVLAQTTDGFRIAEADLRLRGPGEVLGTRQHGLPELRVGDIVADFGLLEQARDDAFALLQADPPLRQPEHAHLLPGLRAMFGGKLALVDAG